MIFLWIFRRKNVKNVKIVRVAEIKYQMHSAEVAMAHEASKPAAISTNGCGWRRSGRCGLWGRRYHANHGARRHTITNAPHENL